MFRQIGAPVLPLVMLLASPVVPYCAGQTAAASASAVKTFANFKHQVELSYPSDWKAEANLPSPETLFIVRPGGVEAGKFNDHVALVAVPAEKGISLKALAEATLNIEMQSNNTFEIGEESDFDWNGVPAHRATYTKKLGPWPLKVLWVFSIRNETSYILMYSANATSFNQHLPQVEQIIHSARWKVDAPPPAVDDERPRAATQHALRSPARPATRPAAAARPVQPPAAAPVITKKNTIDRAAKISYDLPNNWVEAKLRPAQDGTVGHEYHLNAANHAIVGQILLLAHKTGPDSAKSIAAVKKAYLNDQHRVGTDVQIADSEKTLIDGQPAEVVHAAFKAQGKPMKRVFYFTAGNGLGYVFSLQAAESRFDEIEPGFQEFVKSVRWTK